MRIRNAALAGATAIAVAFGGTTVASAATTTDGSSYNGVFGGSSNDQDNNKGKTKGEGSLSSKADLEKKEGVDGRPIFGSSKDFSQVPEWAKLLYGATVAGAIATIAGAIGAAYNFVVHGPWK